MIPEAEHIAQAADADYMLVREIDLSMRVDTGWVSAGRFRTLNDEEDPESIIQGWWLCHAVEEEAEWDMKMALLTNYEQYWQAVPTLLIDDDRFTESLNYLCYGSNDPDVIAEVRTQRSSEEE
jgi:hypothetical protein